MGTTGVTLGLTAILLAAGGAMADVFGTGANQFTIDFVTISGDAGDLGSWPAGYKYTFTGVSRNDYRISVFEITNDQWNKFKASLGVPVTGTPWSAYDSEPYWTGTDVPTNRVSWYEAAQFVNWLNTSKGYQPAYRFTGTQGTGNYALATWSAAEAAGGTNLYRHKDAFYYLPTEDEWVKAAYWNGTSLQPYSHASPEDLVSGEPDPAKWNYFYSGIGQPWNVGSGAEELNGTYDMMGNLWEWMESPFSSGDYGTGSARGVRGGSYNYHAGSLTSSDRQDTVSPEYDVAVLGFRVASDVPEPCCVALFTLGGFALIRRRSWRMP